MEFKVYLFRVGGAPTGRADEGGEFLGVEGGVLDGGICEPAGGNNNIQRFNISNLANDPCILDITLSTAYSGH